MKKVIIALFMLVLAFAAAAWYFLPTYIQYLANHQLGAYGFDIEQIDMQRPGLGHVKIDQLNLSRQHQNQLALKIDITDLVLEFTLMPFFIDKIIIDKMTYNDYLGKSNMSEAHDNTGTTLVSNPSNADSQSDSPPLFSLKQIPFAELTISQLYINAPKKAPIALAQKIAVVNQGDSLNLRINSIPQSQYHLELSLLEDEQYFTSQFTSAMDFSAYQHLLITLLKKTAPELNLSTELKPQIKLSGNGKFDKQRKEITSTISWWLQHPSITGPNFTLNSNQLQGKISYTPTTSKLSFTNGPLVKLHIKSLAGEALNKNLKLPGKLTIAADAFSINYSPERTFSAGKLRLALDNKVNAAVHGFEWQPNAFVTVRSNGNIDLEKLSLPKLPVTAKTIDFAITPILRYQEPLVSIGLNQTAQFTLHGLSGQAKPLAFNSEQLAIDIDRISKVDYSLSTAAFESLTSSGSYKTMAVTSEFDDLSLPNQIHTGTWKSDHKGLKVNHKVSIEGSNTHVTSPMQWSKATNTVSGKYFINTDNTFLSDFNIGDYFPDYKDLISAVVGQLILDGEFALQLDKPETTPMVSLNTGVKNLSFTMGENQFNNIDIPLHVAYGSQGVTMTSKPKIASIQVGDKLAIKNITSDLAVTAQTITVKDSKLEVFDTQLTVDDFSSPLSPIGFTTQARIDNLPIQQIIQTAEVDGLNVEGIMSGALPIRFENNKLFIDDGFLKANKPGLIAYRPDGNLDTVCLNLDNITNFQRYALQNFFYEQLDTRVNYDGELTFNLPMKLRGNNPNFCAGREIILNMNLNYSFPENIWVYFLFGENFLERIKDFDTNGETSQ